MVPASGQSTAAVTVRPKVRRRRMVIWQPPSLAQDVDLGDVPAGQADHGGRALQVSRVPGDGERLRLTREERDVVALPDRGLQLVVAGQLLAAGCAAPQV